MKKKLVIYFIFILLVMNLFIINGSATTYDIIIYDDASSLGDFVVDSNGYLYLIWENTTGDDYIYISKSTDDGDNWVTTNETGFNNDSTSLGGACIDSNDIIHIVSNCDLGATVHYGYYNYNIGTDTWSAYYNLETYSSTNPSVDSTITCDKDDNIYVFYKNEDNNDPENSYVKCRIRNDEGSWSGELSAFSEATTQNSEIKGLSSDTDSVGDVFCSFILEEGVASYNAELYVIQYDRSETTFNELQPLGDPMQNYQAYSTEGAMTDMLVASDDSIHVVFQVEDSTDDAFIRYCYGNTFGGTWYNETIYYYNGYDNEDPSISYSNDGNIHILWCGRDVFYNDRHITMGVEGSFGDWASKQYYAVDDSDDMFGTTQQYQNYPSFTELTSDLIGCTRNTTDTTSLFFNEGDFTFLGEGDGTGDSGFPQCEATGWIIEKQFADSIGYYNSTLAFVIKRTNPLNGLYAIMNSTFDVVQTGSFYGATYPTWYFVDPQYGTGTYYIVAGYYWDVWSVNCSFTIVDSASVSDLWILESTKPVFNVGEDVVLRYVIPDGEYGNITVTEVGDPLETLTISDILGTGEYETISFGVSQVGDLCYHGYLRNSSNNILRASTPQFCIGETFFDYDILVDGVKNLSVTARDTVSISGYVQGIKADVYIFLVYDNLTRYSWPVGDATNKILFSRNWYINYNYTLGDEVYYLYLGTSYGLFEDKYVTLTVSDYTGEPTPFADSSWYGLPFWVPYLIGLFITLFITMSPLIIGTYITRNSRIEKINIPPLLYVGFFYFGLVTSVLMDFLPVWLPFVILFAMIIYFAVTWLAGKQSSVQGE